MIYCRKLATEFGFLQTAPTRVYQDNHGSGAICLAKNGHVKGRTKHVHSCWGFVSDYIDQRRRQARAISASQLARSLIPARLRALILLGRRCRYIWWTGIARIYDCLAPQSSPSIFCTEHDSLYTERGGQLREHEV